MTWEAVVKRAEALGDEGEEILLMEPREIFDKCLVGIVERFNHTFVLYSRKAVLEALAEDADDDDPDYPPDVSAQEYYSFNVVGGWVGDGTPAFLIDDTDDCE